MSEKNEDYYNSLDKRSKEYKDWKKAFEKKKSIGAGDVVEKITQVTRIDKVVKKVFGPDCGCKERKERLNNLRLRFKPLRCFTEEQYNKWTDFINRPEKHKVTYDHQRDIIIPIYAHIFARQLKPMNCCIDPYINEINKVYELK